MIKNQMTLPLGTDTTNIKATTAVFLSATDEQVSPYTIGFVPWDLMSKCVLFGKCSRIFYNSNPNTFFSSYVNPDSYYFNPVKGVPFVYTIRTGYGNKIMHANYSSNSWHPDQIVGEGSNTDLQILHAYNTDYFVQNNVDQDENLTRVEFDIKIYEVIGDGGWTGTASQLESVHEHNYLHISASITDIENINIAFSSTLASYFGTYTYTITQDDWLNCDEHGIFVLDGGDYEYQGQTYKRRLYCACIHASLPSEHTITATSPGYGVLLASGYRSTPHAGSAAWACGWGKCEYGQISDQGYKINPYDYQRQFPSPHGYDSFVSDDVFFFRQATIQWFNHLLHGGATYEDVVVMICTSRPVYKNNNTYYVAEFTDDYYITGKLIPYAQARDWQKNINGDTNEFDPADIPEPAPPSEDEDQTGGVDWNPNTVFAVDSLDGFVTMYALRADQITKFGRYLWAEMWSDDFLNSIGVIFNQNLSLNPSEILNYIVSVRCYPFSISGMAGAASVPDTIYLGRGAEGIALNSGFNILRLSSYSEDIDGGTATIPAYYGDFRDYEPCSRITVFVPFCGSLELAPSQAVGNKVHLRYCVDFSSGAIQATVSIEGAKNNYIAGILTGTVGATVELSASNLSQVIQKVSGLAFNVAKTAALFAIGGEALEGAETLEDGSKALAPFAASAAKTISSVADMSTGVPTTLGTTAGFAAFQATTPIVRIERRYYEIPDNYAHVYGYACNYSVKLETLKGKGYTVCKNVDLEGVPATQDELSAIESLLTSGVYF